MNEGIGRELKGLRDRGSFSWKGIAGIRYCKVLILRLEFFLLFGVSCCLVDKISGIRIVGSWR